MTWNEFCFLYVYQVCNVFSEISLREYLGWLSIVRNGRWWGPALGKRGGACSGKAWGTCAHPQARTPHTARVACPLTLRIRSVYLRRTPGTDASFAT